MAVVAESYFVSVEMTVAVAVEGTLAVSMSLWISCGHFFLYFRLVLLPSASHSNLVVHAACPSMHVYNHGNQYHSPTSFKSLLS